MTAIIVAALALYVISDLRLQASDEAAAAATARATVPAPRITTGEEHPPNSTAAFMATVTGKKSKTVDAISLSSARQRSTPEPAPAALSIEPEVALHTAAAATPVRPEPAERNVIAIGSLSSLGTADLDPDATMEAPASPYDDGDDEATLWPFNDAEMEPSKSDLAELDDVDGLVAMFAKQTEQQLSENKTLTLAGHTVGAGRSGDAPSSYDTDFGAGGGDDEVEMAEEDRVENVEDDEAELPTKGDDVTTEMEMSTEGVDAITNGGVPVADESTSTMAMTPAESAPRAELAPTGPSTAEPALAADDESDVGALARLTAELPTLPAATGADTYTSAGIAPIIDLRPASTAPTTGIESAIRSGEYGVIASLIEQGMLTTEGPITDRDVRTMVYVAFTSSELRKILAAGGTVDGDNSGLELGGVDVFTPPVAMTTGPERAETPALDAAVDDDEPDFPQSQAL
ncbi:MAG: hypothetical protein AAF962_00825 [Actinomycetota bacterium]